RGGAERRGGRRKLGRRGGGGGKRCGNGFAGRQNDGERRKFTEVMKNTFILTEFFEYYTVYLVYICISLVCLYNGRLKSISY
ncbi:MAG: hypothetical protein NC210_09710, partial [[Clostridium] fimetarium]|nr:hypothetical protein [[Clostridium] fimetarium]